MSPKVKEKREHKHQEHQVPLQNPVDPQNPVGMKSPSLQTGNINDHDDDEAIQMLQHHARLVRDKNAPSDIPEGTVPAKMPDLLPVGLPISLTAALGEYTEDIDDKSLSIAQALTSAQVDPSTITVCSWEIDHGQTLTFFLPTQGFDCEVVSSMFAQVHGLLHKCSGLCPVRFLRPTWQLTVNQWYVGSYVQPSPQHVVVVVVQYQPDGATYRTMTVPKRFHLTGVRTLLNARCVTLVRVNGRMVNDSFVLECGDVIEVRSYTSSVPFRIQPNSQRVQICLSACLPPVATPFDVEGEAIEVLPNHSVRSALEDASAWHFDFIPVGVDLHSSTYEALHDQIPIDSATASRLELYIDGATHHGISSWAVVAVFASDDGDRLCGCCAGVTEINASSTQWIGATNHSNIDAETSAMVVATAFSFFAARDLPVHIRPDLELSRHFVQLASVTHHDSQIARLLFMFSQMMPENVSVVEVRAHTGHPWNELADSVARWAAQHCAAIGSVPWHTLNAAVNSPECLTWEWLRHVPASLMPALPEIYDNEVWQPAPSMTALCTQIVREQTHQEHIQVSLQVATYNALALNEEGVEVGAPGQRSLRLDHQFHALGLAIIGVQEARTQEGIRVTDHYKIFSSGHHKCGNALHHGCELWVHKFMPLAKRDDGSAVKLCDCKVTLRRVYARTIVAGFQGPVNFHVVVGHAPCVTAERSVDEVRKWWEDFVPDILSCPSDQCLIGLFDANAPLADHESCFFGTHGAEATNPAGLAFQDFLTSARLHVPSTLGLHVGPQVTWRHPRGHSMRRDYVLVNEVAYSMVHRSEVLTAFDGGFGHLDHNPVVLSLAGFVRNHADRPKLRWDYAKIHSSDAQKAFADSLRTLPVPAWHVDIDDHSAVLENNILQLAQQHFGAPKKAAHRPVLKECTVDGIRLKRQALDMMRTCGFDDPLLKNEIKQFELLLKPKILHDQQEWYATWLADIDTDHAKHDTAQVYRKLQRLGRRKKDLGRGPRPLPRLKRHDGSVAASFSECQHIWQDQFAKIEAGVPVSQIQIQQLHRTSEAIGCQSLAAAITPYIGGNRMSKPCCVSHTL
eukprot:s462_g60.t1